ncbi:MAG: homoserine dehydrogenase [Thaumarchaeota archaeon]|nr:homoserine dehydrogenase [Nitrososphaerota archaeon]
MRIALLGYGTVGTAFHRLVNEKKNLLKEKYGIVPQLVAICDRSGCMVNEEGISYETAYKAKTESGRVCSEGSVMRPMDVIRGLSLDLMVETTTANFKTGEPSLSHIFESMKRGIHVITTNKAPLALHMPALLEEASLNGVEFLYSGTVGGGTPFISFGDKVLRGNSLKGIKGILNGTTNYMLSRVIDSGLQMSEALSEAQRLGIAEADPTLDLNGFDSAAKLVILMNHLLNKRVTISDIKISGIKEDLPKYAGDQTVKLIASSFPEPKVSMEVVKRGSPMDVGGTYNVLEFSVEELDKIYVTGRGAGGQETAASIIRDIVELKEKLMQKSYQI